MTKLKLAVALIVVGMAVTIIYQLRRTHALTEENRGLREQAAQAEQLRVEIEHMSKPGDQTSKQGREQEKVELLRLRGQVGVLRKQLAEAGGARETAVSRPMLDSWTDWADAPEGQQALAKMDYGQGLALSLIVFADQNRGQFPTNFDSAAAFLPDRTKAQTNLVVDQFELLYHGLYNGITNGSQAIVIREKQPWVTPKSQWARIYAFADGHSEVHIEPSMDDLEKWESEHRPSGPAN